MNINKLRAPASSSLNYRLSGNNTQDDLPTTSFQKANKIKTKQTFSGSKKVKTSNNYDIKQAKDDNIQEETNEPIIKSSVPQQLTPSGFTYTDIDSLLENTHKEDKNNMYNPASISATSTSPSESILTPVPSLSSPTTTINSSNQEQQVQEQEEEQQQRQLSFNNNNKKHKKLEANLLGHSSLSNLAPRLVSKNGNVNLSLENISRRKFVRDLFTTMIDIKWRYNLMFAFLVFVVSWLIFACFWYLVSYFHDDLNHDQNDQNWSPCVVNVNSFPTALLFSIEVQSTVGFGTRIISVECPVAIAIFCIQLIFGVVVECLLVGMVFAKLSRPGKRSQTIMFSKFATICLREGKMCLTFRVGDVRSKSHISGATVRASLVSQKITKEGEIIPFYHHQLNLKIDDFKNGLFLIWPVTVVHVINQDSLLYNLNQEQLANSKFEIITVLEGTVESTGQSIQVRSSYLPNEVKWGYRFEPMVSAQGFGRYAQSVLDYKKFNRIIKMEIPSCSPEEFYKQTNFSSTALMFSSSTSTTSSHPPSFESLSTNQHTTINNNNNNSNNTSKQNHNHKKLIHQHACNNNNNNNNNNSNDNKVINNHCDHHQIIKEDNHPQYNDVQHEHDIEREQIIYVTIA